MIRSGYDLLTTVQRHDPAAAAVAIRYPAVGAWALHTVRASRGDAAMPRVDPGQLSAVAAAAAIRARMRAEIEVPVRMTAAGPESGGTVVLPSLGVASVPNSSATVRVNGSDVAVISAGRQVKVPADPHQDAPGWRGVRCFQTGDLEILVDDLDPFRMPAMTNLSPRLSTPEASKWEATIKRAWMLLEQHHPGLAAEVAETIMVIVPLLAQGEVHASSSSPEAFGAIAMSAPPDQYECAVTLVHETQHLKLSALTDIVTLTLPDDGRRFYAPWRPDPRPVSGLLQGTYAHLGVGRFWRRQRQVADGDLRLRAHTEFALWRAAAAQVGETLMSSGQLTSAGLEFARRMVRTLSNWQDEPVLAEAQTCANRQAELHLARWQRDNGPLRA
jgi:HEXXH motif-containing protein